MMLTAFASLEQGRLDVTALLPSPAGPPIASVTQITSLAGGTATNTYGIGPTGAPLIRTVGAIPITGLQVPGPDLLGIRGPGAEPHSLFLVFGIDGFVQTFDPDTEIFTALFTEARMGVFRQQVTGFDRDDPTTWVPFEEDFDSPVITWVLTDPKPVVPGQGEQLDPFDADEVNTSGASAAAAGRATGEFLFVEEFDPGPGHPVPTPPNQGFLDVTTGHEGFIDEPEEGLFLLTVQTTTVKFTGTAGNPQLTGAQQDVLQDISQWALGVDFATSFYDPADSLTGFNPIVTPGGDIQVFDPVTGMGGDFFSNQDNVLAHPILQTPQPPDNGVIIISPDKDNQSLPAVHIVDRETGDLVTRFLAYDESFRGGVHVATGDLTGDGVAEIITAPRRGHTPLVRVFNQSGVLLHEFLAFAPTFTSGIDVAVGDVTDNGWNDIVVGMSAGGSQVQVFENLGGLDFQPYKTAFIGTPGFHHGVTVEVADMGWFDNGATVDASMPDGRAEIIVGNEAGRSSVVHVWDYSGATAQQVRTYQPFLDDFLFFRRFAGGVSLDVARVDNDLIPDIIVGAGYRGESRVQVLSGLDGTVITPTFSAYTTAEISTSLHPPVRVAAVDTTGDGRADRIMTAQGAGGTTRTIRSFEALTGSLVDEFMETHPDFNGAYFITDL